MTEQGKHALSLKGYETEEEAEKATIDSAELLKQYREKKAVEQETELEKLEKQLYVTVSGGTLLGIAVYDPAGTLITDYGITAVTLLRIPHLYQINITWAVEPAMSFAWVS